MPIKYAYVPPLKDHATQLVVATDGKCLTPDYEPNGIPEGLKDWTPQERELAHSGFPVIK